MTDGRDQKTTPCGSGDGRQDRLAKALRDNLRRRKGAAVRTPQTPAADEFADDSDGDPPDVHSDDQAD